MALLQAFGGRLSNVDLQKYLFLFTQTFPQDKSYEFVPYKYGCFSFQSYADRRHLIKIAAIVDAESWKLAGDDDYIAQLEPVQQKAVLSFADKFKSIKGKKLVRHLYEKYPYYAINSEIAREVMGPEELKSIEQAKPKDEKYTFFTIGYEGQSLEHYLNRLIKNNIKMVCDVRKNPLSRKYGFSRRSLSETLSKLGIEYSAMPELGIVSEKRQSLETQEDYDRLFDDYEKTILKTKPDAIDKLYEIFLAKKRIAITCFEADACMCHRSRVAKALSEHPGWKGYEVRHI